MRQAARRKHHILYKTICLITNHYYIGMHSTDDLDDGYLGSGLRLGRSIKKHGKENHRREILEFVDDRLKLKIREKQIVIPQLLIDPLCMNLVRGGEGGAVFGHTVSKLTRQKMSRANKGRKHSDEVRRKMTQREPTRYWTGKQRSQETKLRISEANRGRKLLDEQKMKISNAQRGKKRGPYRKHQMVVKQIHSIYSPAQI